MAGDAKNIQMNEFRVWHLHFFRNDFNDLNVNANYGDAVDSACPLSLETQRRDDTVLFCVAHVR